MRLLRPMGLAWVALIREGTSQVLPPRTLVAAAFGTEPWRSDHELRRRQDRESLEDLLSGTLTLTIAPDETCGYYGDGPTHYVSLIVGDDEDSESTTEITQQAFSSSTSESTSSTSTTAESTKTDETQSISSTTSQPSSSKGGGSSDGGVEVGPIVGGVVGGLAVIGLTVGFLGYMCLRRRNHPISPAYSGPAYDDRQQPYTPETKGTPFNRLRQLVGRSTPPVELPGGTASPTVAYTHRGQE
ncbi:hypothetical protein Neosp_001522 [[Neocosmospora] mangrovei]